MAIALVTSTNVAAGGLNGATTASVDTTGANFLIAAVANAQTVTPTVSDSKGNTWTALTKWSRATADAVRLYYVESPTVGTGHTFTVSATGSAPTIAVSAFSGVKSSAAFDTEQGGSSASSAAVGVGASDLVPSENNELVIVGCCINGTVTSFAAAAGFTTAVHQDFVSGTSYGVGLLYLIQTTAATISSATAVATWTTSRAVVTGSAAFKAASTDTTAPTLTSPSFTATGTTTGTASVTTDEANGTMYCVVTNSATDPSVSQIKAGQDHAGAAADWAGSQSISSTGAKNFSATGLVASTLYYAYFVHTDAAANDSAVSADNTGDTTDAAGAPTSGTASLTSSTASTITVAVGGASGGTPGYTYQWYRSTTANFTAGAGNLQSGATSTSFADNTGLSADTPYYYKCIVTDSASQTATSNEVAGVLKAATLILGFIGDSITNEFGLSAGEGPAAQCGLYLEKLFKHRAVTVSEQGVNSSTTAQWASGQSNLTTAKSAFSSAGVTHVHIMLGANDAAAANLVSAATFKTNLQSCADDLVAAGYTVILSYPTFIPAGANSNATTAASVALAQSYQAQIDSLINNTTILRGDVLAFNYFINELDEYQSDKTHPSVTGAKALGLLWARAIDRALYQRTVGRASVNVGI